MCDHRILLLSGRPKEGTILNEVEYTRFSLSIAAREDSLTKYAAHVWDYDPESGLLSRRSGDDGLPNRHVEVASFVPLVIGEDVRGTAPDGGEVWLGELKAFTLNEAGVAIPAFLVP